MSGELLFVAHRIPFPPDRGDKLRSFHILRRLAEAVPVHLVTFVDRAADRAHLEGLKAVLGTRLLSARVETRRSLAIAGPNALLTGRPASVAAYAHAGLRKHIEQLYAERPIAAAYAFSGQSAALLPPFRLRAATVDFVDVDSAKFEAYAARRTGLSAAAYAREARTLARFEAEVAARARRSLFVSDAEAALFTARTGLRPPKVHVVENGVDLDRFAPLAPAAGEPLIVFTGQMDYPPNVEAVVHFAHAVLPRIRRAEARARFAIVGRAPTTAVRALAREGVEVTGEVPDVRPWLAAARIVVAPLLTARGVQNKILEAMASSRAVVASPAAFEGIDAVPGEELLVADDPMAFATACLQLLRDPEAAADMGRAARARAELRYGWDAQLRQLPGLVLA